MSTLKATLLTPKRGWQLPALTLSLAALWFVAWGQLQSLADWLTYSVIGLPPDTQLAESINFFLYDVPKILLLLAGMIFLVTLIRSFFSTEQTRALLGASVREWAMYWPPGWGWLRPFVPVRPCRCSSVLWKAVFRWG